MIPSDHYVRMYNEMFKMLEERGHAELQAYWRAIAKQQEAVLAPFIEKDGLKGMFEYWDRIRIEENCEAVLTLTDEYFEFLMLKCPSLTKAMDNDAGAFLYYCDHCAAWVKPVVEKFGYHNGYDIVSRTEPVCKSRIYKDKAKAEAYQAKAKLPAHPYD
jgi:hypothetical protein